MGARTRRIILKARTSAFYWTMSCPIFYFSGKHGDDCNKLNQVCQLFFPMIVDANRYIVTEMIKPCTCIRYLKVWWKWLIFIFFFFFLSLVCQILHWQNFACQFAKMSYLRNPVTYMTCTLVLTAMSFYALLNISLFFFEIQGLSSQRQLYLYNAPFYTCVI